MNLTDKELKERHDRYVAFMCKPENRFKCSECPHDKIPVAYRGVNQYPCGQYRCWVDAHCKRL